MYVCKWMGNSPVFSEVCPQFDDVSAQLFLSTAELVNASVGGHLVGELNTALTGQRFHR